MNKNFQNLQSWWFYLQFNQSDNKECIHIKKKMLHFNASNFKAIISDFNENEFFFSISFSFYCIEKCDEI